jgi:hypothetical protein
LAIASADKAIETGSVDTLSKLISDAATKGVQELFQEVQARKGFAAGDVGAGREYVKVYVDFIHYVEGLHNATQRAGDRHSQGSHDTNKDPAH